MRWAASLPAPTEESQAGRGRRGSLRRAPEGKGQGQGKRQKQEPGLPPTADTTTGGAPTDRGPAHLFDAEARVTIAGAGQHRPISALFASRSSFPDAQHPPADPTVEGATRQGHLHAAAPSGLGTAGDTGDPGPLHEVANEGQSGSPLAEGHPTAPHHPGGLVALSTMGSDSEEATSVAQQDPYQGGTDSESLGGTPGVHAESGPPTPVQELSTAADIQEDRDPLPAPSQSQGQQTVRNTVMAEPQLGLDAGGGQTPTTHGAADPAGDADPQRAGTQCLMDGWMDGWMDG